VVVGVLLWAIHWYVAQRGVVRPEEQHSALRRFYAYLVLLVAMLGLLIAAQRLLAALLGVEPSAFGNSAVPPAISALLVNGAIWGYHWRVFAGDRAVVERVGWTATWRRWYLVVVQAVTLALASFGAVDLLRQLIQLIVSPTIGGAEAIRAPLATMIAGFAFWLPHHLWAHALVHQTTSLQAGETRSTLRQVFAALVITTSAVAALTGLVIIVEASLLAAFGGVDWGGELRNHVQAASMLLIALAIWIFHRKQLSREAHLSQDAARGDTARRIVGYLMGAIGVGALFFGLGGLLATFLRLAFAPDVIGTGWREPLSLYLALSMVALLVYVLAAQSMERLIRTSPEEEQTLARRIFLYAILLFGIVVGIFAVVALLRLLLAAGLGESEPGITAEIGRWLGYTLIAGAIVVYHGMLLRRVGVARPASFAAAHGMTVVIVVDDAQRGAFEAAVGREAPGTTLRFAGFTEPELLKEKLDGADMLIVPLGAVLGGVLMPIVRSFTGHRLVLPLDTQGYHVVGPRYSLAALAREAAQALRRVEDECGYPLLVHSDAPRV
jgi:hypothetical protein